MLHALCLSVTANLAVMGASVSLRSERDAHSVAAASDERCRDLAELLFSSGEGPGRDAFASRRPVLTPDLNAVAHRWPAYAPAAMDHGVGSVFAFPLHVGDWGFGALSIYADKPTSLGSEDMTLALTYAQVATEILLDGDLVGADGQLSPGVSVALDHHALIHQAQGMVMVDLDVDPVKALVLMRERAAAHDQPLIDLARDIVDGFDLRKFW